MVRRFTKPRLSAIAVVLCIATFATLGTAAADRPAGITVKLNRNGTIGRLLGTVRKGRCHLEGDSFRFRADRRGLSLHVDIDEWQGYGHRYSLTVGSPGKVFVDRAGVDNGAYSSEFAIPGSMAGTAAVVEFRHKGRAIHVGAPDLPNFDYSGFLLLSGAARCVRR